MRWIRRRNARRATLPEPLLYTGRRPGEESSGSRLLEELMAARWHTTRVNVWFARQEIDPETYQTLARHMIEDLIAAWGEQTGGRGHVEDLLPPLLLRPAREAGFRR